MCASLRHRLRDYYTRYYRDVLAIPDWKAHVAHRDGEHRHERVRVDRILALAAEDLRRRPMLNVGCGTGGFNVAAEAAGLDVVGVDEDAEAIAICGLRRAGGRYVRAAAEALPFRDGAFALIHCFSVIEHVASVEGAIAEMVRVTQRGGAVYVHTPNAWSLYEGHYKIFWLPFLPRAIARLYLRARGRPTGYLAALRRLTVRRLARAFHRAGVTRLERGPGEPARMPSRALRLIARVYYGVTGITPFIELLARRT